jgi:hypothetical protein
LRVEIGSRGKITDVTSPEKVMAFEYLYHRSSLESNAETYKAQAARLKDKSVTMIGGVNLPKLAIRQRELIKELDAAATICK